MGWQSRLLLLASFGVLVIMVGESLAKTDSEQVHKLPTDDRPKRSGDGDAQDEDKEKNVDKGSGEKKDGDQNMEPVKNDEDVAANGKDQPQLPAQSGDGGNDGPANSLGDGGNDDQTDPSAEEGGNDGSIEQPAVEGGNSSSTKPPAEEGGNSSSTEPPVDPPPAPNTDPAVVDPLHANFRVYYDATTGNCYTGKDKEEAMKKKDLANGKILVHDEKALPMCMADFDKIGAKKTCGTPKYDQLVYCAKVQFYGEGGVAGAKKYMEVSAPPTTLAEYRPQYMQSNIFVFVDGCVQCKGNAEATIEFWQIHPVGPISQICPEEVDLVNSGKGKEKKFNGQGENSAPFLTGSMLKERLCVTRPDENSDPKMSLRYYYNAKIVVRHSCGAEKSEHTIMFGTTIEKKEINNNVFHLRNVNINLDGKSGTTSETITWDWAKKNRGLGYFYYEPDNAQEVDSDGAVLFDQAEIQQEIDSGVPDLPM